MRFSTYAVLILIVWSMVGGWQTSAQDDAEIPYIHYYSDLLGGLVIERADGTDSRVLDIEAGFVDWSPSGKWFTVKDVAIFSTDGSQLIPYPQLSERREFTTEWSPIDDVILVVNITAYRTTIRAQLYDVPTQIILADFSFSNPPLEFIELDLEWSSTGHEAYVFLNDYLLTLSRDGTGDLFIQLPRSGYVDPLLFEEGRLLSYDWSIHLESIPQFAIRDVETNVWRSVNDLAWSRRSVIRWNPSRNHALLYTPDCPEEDCEPTLKLLNWQTGYIAHVSPNLPLLQRERYCPNFIASCKNIWSPSGRYAVLDDKDQRTLYLLDIQTGETKLLSVWGFYEWATDDILFIQTDTLYQYNPATDELIASNVAAEYDIPYFSVSLDGHFTGVSSNPASVIDNRTGEIIIQIAPPSIIDSSTRPVFGYRWHPSGAWAMADYSILFGGAGVEIASIVFDLAGTVRRELPVGGMAGFMPERAIPHLSPGQPTSVKTEPTYTLVQQGFRPCDFQHTPRSS